MTDAEIREIQERDGLYLWVRQDGQPPKSIQPGRVPPGPGPIVAVKGAKSVDEARKVYAQAVRWRSMSADERAELLQTNPSVKGFLELADLRVKEVKNG